MRMAVGWWSNAVGTVTIARGRVGGREGTLPAPSVPAAVTAGCLLWDPGVLGGRGVGFGGRGGWGAVRPAIGARGRTYRAGGRG
jgi:hypothetical protein